jgi:hypothetical protein
MMAGHLVVILTILWMQRSVLNKLVGNRDTDIEIRRIAESAFDNKTTTLEENAEVNDDETEPEEIVEVDELVEIVEEDSQEMEENWQEDSTIEWGKQVETISDEVEWKDDVIELDD